MNLSLMFQSVAGVFKGLVTYSTGVGSLIGVGQHVLLQVLSGATHFPTETTRFIRVRQRSQPFLQHQPQPHIHTGSVSQSVSQCFQDIKLSSIKLKGIV